MIKNALDFPQMPKRDNIYRDGYYILDISGEWEDTLKYSRIELDLKNFKHRGDLTYLKSRALEYQLKFKRSAK